MSIQEIPDPSPAGARPPMLAGLAHAVAQVLGGAAAAAGLYLLAGLAWTLVAGGLAVLVGSLVLEYLATRPPAPPPLTGEDVMRMATRGGDR